MFNESLTSFIGGLQIHICTSSLITVSLRCMVPNWCARLFNSSFWFYIANKEFFFTVTVFYILGWFGRLLAVSRVLQHKCSKKCTSNCSQLLPEYYTRWISFCGRFSPIAYPKANTSGKIWTYFTHHEIVLLW